MTKKKTTTQRKTSTSGSILGYTTVKTGRKPQKKPTMVSPSARSRRTTTKKDIDPHHNTATSTTTNTAVTTIPQPPSSSSTKAPTLKQKRNTYQILDSSDSDGDNSLFTDDPRSTALNSQKSNDDSDSSDDLASLQRTLSARQGSSGVSKRSSITAPTDSSSSPPKKSRTTRSLFSPSNENNTPTRINNTTTSPTINVPDPVLPSITEQPPSTPVETNDEPPSNPTNEDSNDTQAETQEPAQQTSVPPPVSRTSFKPVNSRSTHRRNCVRLELDEEMTTGTPPRVSNLSSHNRNNTTRVSVKLTIPPAADPEKELMRKIKEFSCELFNADDSLVILPWKSRNINKGLLTKAADLPTTLDAFRVYTKKIWAAKANVPATTYFNLCMGHDMSLTDIKDDILDWLNSGKHGLYVEMLQKEDGLDIGWLLYSTQAIDAGALADEIYDMTGVELGLRWKQIDTGQREKVPASQQIKALVVEVEKTKKIDYMRKLQRLLGSTKKLTNAYPNGIRLRYVKNLADAYTVTEKAKIHKLRNRQKLFTRDVLTATSYDVIQLDYSPISGQPTLRQMIMNIKCKENTTTPLFHAVDLDWKGEGYAFQFSPNNGEEAACVMNTLMVILKHHYPEANVESSFSDGCKQRCRTLTYDVSRGEVYDTAEHEHGNYQFDLADTDDLGGFSFNDTNNDIDSTDNNRPTRPTNTDPRPPHFPADDDSVSTFGGGLSRQGFPPSVRNRFSANLQQVSTDGSTGDLSAVTGTTNTTNTTPNTSTIDQIAQLESRLNSVMDLLQRNLLTAGNGNTANLSDRASQPLGSTSEAGGASSSPGSRLQ